MVYISKIRVQNFKSLEDVTVDIKPLTLLIGKNSSGKSSFMKALMFLDKNLFPLRLKDLIFQINDDVNLESYEETVFNHDLSNEIKFELTLKGEYYFFSDKLLEFDDEGKIKLENKFFSKISGNNLINTKDDLVTLYNYFISEKAKEYIFMDGEDYYDDSLVKKYPFHTAISYTYFYDKTSYLKSIEIEDKIIKTKISYVLGSGLESFRTTGYFGVKTQINYDNMKINRNNKLNLLRPILCSESKFFKITKFSLYENTPGHLSSLNGIINDDINDRKRIYPDQDPLSDINENKLNYFTNRGYLKEKYRCEYDKNLNNEDLMNLYFEASKVVYGESFIIPMVLETNLHNKHLSTVREIPKLKYLLNSNKNFDNNLYYSFPNVLFDDIQILKNYINKYEETKPQNILKSVIDLDLSQFQKTINSEKENSKYIGSYYYKKTPLFFCINNNLKIFGYDKYLYIEKNDTNDVGYLHVLDKSGSKFKLTNESSGLIQLLPIIITLSLNEYFYIFNFNITTVDFSEEEDNFDSINKGPVKRTNYNYFMILVEQPELHLHPKAQSELANLFVENLREMNFNKRYIIETHSEHLVNRLQVLISKKLISTKDVSIQYFDNENDKITIKTIKIHQNGLFKDNWPEGFLDQSYNNSVDLLFGSN